tara:strand:+ start:26 stop:1090 length:1065 start_codon:yes stop_codon:yes gene_type:complete
MKKTKIIFIVPDLNSGGSQKFLLNLMNQLDDKKFDLYLFPKRFTGNFVEFIPRNVQILNFSNLSVLKSASTLYGILKTYKPDFTFSVLNRTNLLNIICSKLFFFNHKIIIRESNSPINQLNNNSIPKLQLFMGKIIYHFSDYVISQTDEMREDILNFYYLNPKKVLTIGNLINNKNLSRLSTELNPFDKNTFNIVAVGRLEKQKGYDLLLNSLKVLSLTIQKFHCYICGETETEYSKHIYKLTNDLNLTNNITFVGYTSNPYKYIVNANVFILTSYFEGLPNVILEARFLRVPIVVTNTLKIYYDIISKTDGFITSFDENEIAEALIKSKKLTPKPYVNSTIKEFEKLFLCLEE